ncbi:MAG: helix-turn-helix domain-containing protein [Gemmataceae bacterium]
MTVVPKIRQASLGRFIVLPENRAAVLAVQDILAALDSERSHAPFNPLTLHGPSGVGKTFLLTALAGEVKRRGRTALLLSSRELKLQRRLGDKAEADAESIFTNQLGEQASACALLILEDLQAFPLAAIDRLVALLDERLACGTITVLSAPVGPSRLAYRDARFPARLTNRLAGGLVVALEPLQPASRKAFLRETAQRRQLALAPDVVDWLGDHLVANGRELEGALTQLETLGRLGRRLERAGVIAHFTPQIEAAAPSVDRILEEVGGYFQVKAKDLQSKRRYHNVLLARQVGMYLTRKLTKLSLEQIGAHFGGRDHTTVLHACRKVEAALQEDALLSGAVKDLSAELR